MKSTCLRSIWIMAFLTVLFHAGCQGPQPPSSQPNNSDENDTSLETPTENELQQSPDPATENLEESISITAFDTLAKLGCDTSALEVTSIALLPSEYSLLWGVIIGNDLEEIASFHINEENLRVEFVSVFHAADIVVPPLKQGEKITAKIAEALGLEEEGYRHASWLNIDEGVSEYRKHATWGEWEIVIGRIHIAFPSMPDAPFVLNRTENELKLPVNIQINRDAAVSAAQSFLGETDSAPSHVELIQLRSEPYSSGDFSVYWEVVIGDQTVHVRADDGTI